MADPYRKRAEDAHKPPTSIDDLVSRNAVAKLRKDMAKGGGAKPAGSSKQAGETIDDADLIASMAKRLSVLEKELKVKTQELARLAADNDALRHKLRAADKDGLSSPLNVLGAGAVNLSSEQLLAENTRLRESRALAWKHVSDMKAFLSDYGMVWVGDGEAGHRRGSEAGGPSGAGLPPRPPPSDRPDPAAGLRPDVRRRSYTGGSGSNSTNGAEPGQLLSPSQRTPADGDLPSPAGLPFRMSDLLSKVQELNQLAGDGCGKLVPEADGSGGHVLHTPEPVRLVIFRDGMQLHRQPPKPYQDSVVASILADILDGYFPTPLKKEFPDGIPIKVIDQSGDSYKDSFNMSPTPAGNIHTFHDLETGESKPLTREQFLARLPQAVIKNGKVIDIRSGVGSLMSAPVDAAPDTHVTLVPTPVDDLLTTSQRNHKGPVLPPPSREAGARAGPGRAAPEAESHQPNAQSGQEHRAGAAGGSGAAGPPSRRGSLKRISATGEMVGGVVMGQGSLNAQAPLPAVQPAPSIATLQVKSEDGQQTLIVKLQYDDNIQSLRKYINAHRSTQNDGRSADYEIRTAFPPRKYEDHETLRAAGLVPNATLFLRSVST